MVLGLIAAGIIGFLVGFIFTAAVGSSQDIYPWRCEHFDYETNKLKILSLETQIEHISNSCRIQHGNWTNRLYPYPVNVNCCHHEKVLAKTPSQQEVIDMFNDVSTDLKKGTKALEKLLDIDYR